LRSQDVNSSFLGRSNRPLLKDLESLQESPGAFQFERCGSDGGGFRPTTIFSSHVGILSKKTCKSSRDCWVR
jgi:hypothetical protein